jgi:predicted MFS family arabinose efflux permease
MSVELSVPARERAVFLLAMGGFASGANVRVMDTVLPQLAGEFGVPVGLAAQTVTAYALGYGSMQIVLGIAGDRFGKMRLVTVLCFASVAACLLAAAAASLGQLSAARLLCGAAASAIIPVSLAWVGDMAPFEERQPILARYASGGILGMVTGQIVGGLATEYWNWRAALLVVAVVYLIAGIGLMREARRNPLITARPIATGAARLSSLAAIAAMLKRPWSRIVLASVFLEGITVYAAVTFVGIELKARFDLNYGLIGVMLAFFAVGGMLFTRGMRQRMRTMTPRRLIATGAASASFGMILFPIVPTLWLVPILMILVGFGAYMLHNTLQTFATQLLPEARATGFSVFATLFFLSQSLGVAVGALMLDDGGAGAVFVAAALVLSAFGLWFGRRAHRREVAREI